MAYYAPFYRPTYYDPVQQSQMGQFNQQYQQPIAQTMQQAPMQTQPTNDFLWVLNENEATSYPVAPNNTVTLWDKNLPTIYIKSVNAQGVPSMRILDFTERSSAANGSADAERTNADARTANKRLSVGAERERSDFIPCCTKQHRNFMG